MADDATLTIAVKVRDEATRQLGALSGRVRSVLLTPFNAVGKSLAGITKSLFGFKSLLLGGGIIAATRSLTDGLAKNAKQFESVFSPETQSRLDAAGTAFNKLGASLKTTFGNLVAEFKLDEKLNAVSDWLQENQQSIIDGFRKTADAVKEVATYIYDAIKAFKEFLNIAGGAKSGQFDKSKDLVSRNWRGESIFVSGTGGGSTDFIGPPLPGASAEEQRIIDEYLTIGGKHSNDLVNFTKVQDAARESMAKTAPIVQEITKAQTEAAASTAHLGDKTTELTQAMIENTDIIRGYLTVGEAASSIANGMTDAFFDAINGTKSFGRAFADMTVSILNDISRLLVFRALFSVVSGAIGGGIGGSTSPTGGAAGLPDAGGSLSAGFNGQSFAMGTSSARGGIATVGERGPERVILPRGARVEPSHRSGQVGGITINVVGARDPQATAAEVVTRLKVDPAFRRLFK